MAEDLVFKDEAAAEYDRAVAHVASHFMPFLLRAPVSRRACASSTSRRARGFRPKRPSPPSVPPAMSPH
jgi:hypothetical protein